MPWTVQSLPCMRWNDRVAKTQSPSANPPTPCGFSRLCCGPAPNPSIDMDALTLTLDIGSRSSILQAWNLDKGDSTPHAHWLPRSVTARRLSCPHLSCPRPPHGQRPTLIAVAPASSAHP